MDTRSLAQMIDHTFLKAFGTPEDIERLCAEAAEWQFGAVCVHPCNIERCAHLLSGTPVRICTVAGFPLGQMTSTAKAFEIRDAIDRGAQEVDMVVNVRAVHEGDEETVRQELRNLAEVCAEAGATSKVILENCYLTDDEKRLVCAIAVEEGVDFVKTSTGFGTGGATVADVRLMKAAVGDNAKVKAAGGIRTYEDAIAMIEAGAERIGASSGVSIMRRAIEIGQGA
jgi:deoxyribose-phosphate aldolase